MTETLNDLTKAIADKKAELDALQPLHPDLLDQLQKQYDIELTYTSNAIEGNTLTGMETQLVIEKGITIGGKPLRDHLEAIDHHEALSYVRELAGQSRAITEFDIRQLHHLVVQRSAPKLAGRYAENPRFVLTDTGRHYFPSPAEIPAEMGTFSAWLDAAYYIPHDAFMAHKRVVDIHPFGDGNGRTARLLMNLMLIRGGYPPVAVRPEDRLTYVRSLAACQSGGGEDVYQLLMHRRLHDTLGEYVSAFQNALPQAEQIIAPIQPKPKGQ
jgi:Fic family protein